MSRLNLTDSQSIVWLKDTESNRIFAQLSQEAEEQFNELIEEAQEARDIAVNASNYRNPVFNTVEDAENADIGENIAYIRTSGMFAVGDGGAGMYARVEEEPPHPAKFQGKDGSWWELTGSYVSLLHFGGDQNNLFDNKDALEAALAYCAYFNVPLHIPSGTYKIQSTVDIPSGVTVFCDPTTVFTTEGWTGATTDPVLRFAGNIGDEINLAENRTYRDKTVVLETEPTIQEGDFFLLRGQRNALSRADAGDFWCGAGTASLSSTFFTEWHQARSVTGTTINLSWPIHFPDYLTTDVGETFPGPNGRKSRVMQISPCVGSKWVGGKIINSGTVLGVMFYLAANCSIENVIIDTLNGPGVGITMARAFRCRAFNCEVHSRGAYEAITDRNHLKMTGAQECEFDSCRSYGGSQSVDITYSASSGPSIRCRVVNCGIYGSQSHAISTHPGTFAIDITGNHLVDCLANGIVVRGPYTMVVNNRISGLRETSENVWGISLNSAGGFNSLVEGNYIDGFNGGIILADGALTDQNFTWVGAKVTNNYIYRCSYGLWRTRQSTSMPDSDMSFTFSHNTIYKPTSQAIYVGPYTPGTDILYNTIYSEANNYGINVDTNNPYTRIIGNKIHGKVSFGIRHLAVTDANTFPDWKGTCVCYGNNIKGATTNYYLGGVAGTANNELFKAFDGNEGFRTGALILPKIAKPNTVNSNTAMLYVKSDGSLYFQDGDGNETKIV